MFGELDQRLIGYADHALARIAAYGAKGIELLQEDDCGAGVFSFLTLGLEFVADFSGADEDAVGFSDFDVENDVQEILVREVFDG